MTSPPTPHLWWVCVCVPVCVCVRACVCVCAWGPAAKIGLNLTHKTNVLNAPSIMWGRLSESSDCRRRARALKSPRSHLHIRTKMSDRRCQNQNGFSSPFSTRLCLWSPRSTLKPWAVPAHWIANFQMTRMGFDIYVGVFSVKFEDQSHLSVQNWHTRFINSTSFLSCFYEARLYFIFDVY